MQKVGTKRPCSWWPECPTAQLALQVRVGGRVLFLTSHSHRPRKSGFSTNNFPSGQLQGQRHASAEKSPEMMGEARLFGVRGWMATFWVRCFSRFLARLLLPPSVTSCQSMPSQPGIRLICIEQSYCMHITLACLIPHCTSRTKTTSTRR